MANNKMGEQTKHKIIMVAKEIFNEKDYDEVKVEDIAEKAGITKTMVYYYFNSKEEMMINVLEELLSSIEETIKGVLDRTSKEEICTIYEQINKVVEKWIENKKIISLIVIKLIKEPEYNSRVYSIIRNFYNKFARINGVTDYKDDNLVAEEQVRLLLFNGIPMIMYPFFVNCLTSEYELSEEEVKEIFLKNFMEVLNK